MNERNSIMTKKLSGVVVLLSIVVLLTNGCVYDLLNASIKLDGKECKTPTGEWDRNQKYVECVSFDGVEAEVVPYCDGIGLVVYAVGKFNVDERPVKEFVYEKYMSVGLFPAFTGDRRRYLYYDSLLIFTWDLAWPNAVLLGFPTVCGLLINPVVEADWVNELSETTLAGAWRYRGKTCEVIREGVEAKKSVDRIPLKDCALSIKGNHGLVFSKDGVFPIDDRWRGQVIVFSIESQPFGWGIKDVVEKCKGKTFRVAIDGEIAPSRSQSAMGGARLAAASERSR